MHKLEALANWSATLDRRTIPEDVRLAARVQLANMLAATYLTSRGGDAAPIARAQEALNRDQGGSATVLPTGRRRPPIDAAYENAGLSMAHDFDDIVWMGHTCHSAVFASVAIAEHEGKSFRDLVDAIVVSNEVAGRLGASAFLGPLNGQMWTFIHLIGAATAGARLLELDAQRTCHAMAIALAQPNFALQPAFMRPTSKLLSASTPIATGIRAAYLAQEGMTGAPEILEDPRGFWARFAFVPLPDMLTSLGDFWVLRTLTFKTYPTCHYFQTALEAIARLTEGRTLGAYEVSHVEIRTTKFGCEVTNFAGDYLDPAKGPTPVSACFDLATAAAIHLHCGRLTVDELSPEFLATERVALERWQRLIRVKHDPELTARVIDSARHVAGGRASLARLRPRDLIHVARRYRAEYRSTAIHGRDVLASIGAIARRLSAPKRSASAGSEHAPVPLAFPAEVRIQLTDGTLLRRRIDVPMGAFGTASAEHALRKKLLCALTPTLGEERAARAVEATLSADLASAQEWVALVTPAASPSPLLSATSAGASSHTHA